MRRQTLCGSKLGDTKVAAPLSKTAPRASNALAFFSAARKRRTSAAFGVRPRCGFPVRTIESRKLAALAGAQEVQTHLHIDDPIVKGASSTKRRINVETTTRPPNRGTSSREDQGHAAKQLKDAHRQPISVGNRFQGRHSSLGIGKLPHRAHSGMQGEKDLKDP